MANPENPRLRPLPDSSPEARKKRAEENLARAEQQRLDSARAYADYEAESVHQNANMARLRELRLAKEAADRAAANAPTADRAAKDRLAGDGGARAAPSTRSKSKKKTAAKAGVPRIAGAAHPSPKPR